jgi:hypothetical protein
MYIRRLIYSDFGSVIMSIILGLGLATLFRKVCKDRNCMKFVGPPINKIKGQIFKYQDKCYSYEPTIIKCNDNKKIIPFA